MFSKAQSLVSSKIQIRFRMLNAFRKEWISEKDPLITKWKVDLENLYRLSSILQKYSYDQDEQEYDFDPAEDNCKALY